MLVNPRIQRVIEVAGVRQDQERRASEAQVIGDLRADVQVAVLTEKWNACNCAALHTQGLHFVELDDVAKTHGLQ